MKYFKFNYHSLVDVITNSSTTIYTYSDNCIKPAKELITEFAKAMGIDTDVDEMFDFAVFCDENTYVEYWEDHSCDCDGDCDDKECTCDNPFKNMDWKEQRKAAETLIHQVGTNSIAKPSWMNKAEENKYDYYDYEKDTTLYIFPKDEKYVALADAMTKFLYSTSHEAGYDS